MPSAFLCIVGTIIGLGLIVIPLSSAIHFPSIDYDVNLTDIKIFDIQVISLDDTPGYYYDNSDLLKITVNVTNNALDYFLVSDKMFQVWVMQPNFRTGQGKVSEIIDNYNTSYDDELEVRYDNLQSRELFEECNYTHDIVEIGQSKIFTLCFDVLRIWNNEVLNLDDSKKYYLVMMNNDQASSCPNCKKVLLSPYEFDNQYGLPQWVQNLVEWHNQGIISDQEYQNSIKYLISKGVIPKIVNDTKHEITVKDKNQQLKEHQEKLSLAQQTNLYVSAANYYKSDFDQNAFSGILCKRQNNIVVLSGDYTNDDAYHDAVFFKLLVVNELKNIVATGLSKIVDLTPKEFVHFSVSTHYAGKMNSCSVIIDSKFPHS